MIYVFLADGFEECEALIPIDILKRANFEVVTVGVTGKTVIGSHNIPIICDTLIENINLSDDFWAIILPGGMPGTTNLDSNENLLEFVSYSNKNNKLIAAICAAPMVLGKLEILKDKNAVCYPGFEKYLIGAKISNENIAIDGNIITAKGVGAAFDFGYAILEHLTCDTAKSKELKQAMIYSF